MPRSGPTGSGAGAAAGGGEPAGRRGKKRAIAALGHTMLVMMSHMLLDGRDCRESGHDDLDNLQPRRLIHDLEKRLESPGRQVALRPGTQAA